MITFSAFSDTLYWFKTLNRILTIPLVFLLLIPLEKVFAQDAGSPSKKLSSSYKEQTISYKLIITNDHTYGYDVFISDNLFIHQPVIPCLSGNKGFKSKSDAKKVAVLVIEKIRKGLIPPTITIPEMQKLGVKINFSK